MKTCGLSVAFILGFLALTTGVVSATPVNVALRKTVSASSLEVPALKAEKVVDGIVGKRDSRWSSRGCSKSSPQWLAIDLGQVQKLAGVVIHWELAYAKTYSIQIKDAEKDTWRTVFSQRAGQGKIERITFKSPTSARYIRLLATEANLDVAPTISIEEFAVYTGSVPPASMAESLATIPKMITLPETATQVVLPPLPKGYTVTLVNTDSPSVIDLSGRIRQPLSCHDTHLCYQVKDEVTGKLVYIPYTVRLKDDVRPAILPVIPAVQEWAPAQGELVLGKEIRVRENKSAEVKDVANAFLSDAAVRANNKATQRLNLTLSQSKEILALGKEGYQLRITAQGIDLQAATSTGLFYGTQTVLQLLDHAEGTRVLPQGLIRDYPRYAIRGFMLDVGRKFSSMEFLRSYSRIMGYYKMNTFQIHLNDNGFKKFFGDWDKTYAAYRLESTTYPGLAAKDGSYSKAEFRTFVKDSAKWGVNVIPEIDSPAHALAFTRYLPAIGSEKYGLDHVDLYAPELVPFMTKLFDEYMTGDDPVFAGPDVHVGTDEYSRDEAEAFRKYTDTLLKHVAKAGKNPCAWGALTHARGKTPVLSKGVTLDMWHNPYHQPLQAIEEGYDIVAIPDGMIYLVPAAGYYYDYLNIQHLYNNWEPNTIGNVTLPVAHPQLKGGKFALWNDHVGNGISDRDCHDRIFPAVQTLAQKFWSGKQPAGRTFDTHKALMAKIGEAPGINLGAKVPVDQNDVALTTFKKPVTFTAKDTKTLPLEEIGWTQKGGYTVTFTIKPTAKPASDTPIFRAKDATFKLNQGDTGLLGFSREGYNYTFNYSVPHNVWTTLTIKGDHKGTDLYVNGTLQEKLRGQRRTFPNSKDTTAKVQTLIFPLRTVGGFQGEMKDLTVKIGL